MSENIWEKCFEHSYLMIYFCQELSEVCAAELTLAHTKDCKVVFRYLTLPDFLPLSIHCASTYLYLK